MLTRVVHERRGVCPHCGSPLERAFRSEFGGHMVAQCRADRCWIVDRGWYRLVSHDTVTDWTTVPVRELTPWGMALVGAVVATIAIWGWL